MPAYAEIVSDLKSMVAADKNILNDMAASDFWTKVMKDKYNLTASLSENISIAIDQGHGDEIFWRIEQGVELKRVVLDFRKSLGPKLWEW